MRKNKYELTANKTPNSVGNDSRCVVTRPDSIRHDWPDTDVDIDSMEGA